MNSSKGTCCGRCFNYQIDDGIGGFKQSFCSTPSCQCHQPVEEYKNALEKTDKLAGGALRVLGGDTPTPDWREDFKKKFTVETFAGRQFIPDFSGESLIEFIAGVEARTQHQTTQKIIEEIEGMKEKTRNFPMKSNGGNWDEWNDGYDKALSDILAVIRANLPQEK